MRTSLSFSTLTLLASSVALTAFPTLRAEDAPAAAPEIVELTKDVDKAVDRGCAWLAKNQGHDGSWGSEGSSG